MDRNIDLTTNRDFRQRVSPSIPRSIFHKKDNSPSKHLSRYASSQTQTMTPQSPWLTDMGTYNGMSTTATINYMNINGTMHGSNYDYVPDGLCDCCGKDISRIPWKKEMYGDLCKECTEALEFKKRIPWK